MRLKDKIAIITGSGLGLGSVFAEVFAREGATVIIAEYNEEAGKETEEIIKNAGGNAFFIKCDVSKEDEVKNVVKTTIEKYGRIDILVNNAQGGMNVYKPIIDTEQADMRLIFETGLLGTFYFIRECIPHMLEQKFGRIINLSSYGGIAGLPNISCYAATKEAIRGFSRSVTNEYAQYGITCNNVCPFAVAKRTTLSADIDPEVAKRTAEKLTEPITAIMPARRVGDPEKDVAPLLVFLASDEAGFICGQTIGADGGLTMLP